MAEKKLDKEETALTVEDCMAAAFQALLRGDTAERDQLCAMAERAFKGNETIPGNTSCTAGEGRYALNEVEHQEAIAKAEKELAEANQQLGHHTITERDIIRRNQAERRFKELREGLSR